MKTHKLGKSLTFLRMTMFHKTINFNNGTCVIQPQSSLIHQLA